MDVTHIEHLKGSLDSFQLAEVVDLCKYLRVVVLRLQCSRFLEHC